MIAKRVLSVGQCGADHWSISRTLQRAFAVEVEPAATAVQALQKLRQGSYALVLVNRVFDADGGSGLDLIGQLKADGQLREVPVMLVSNYADAQQQATAAGALPGFGKASLGSPQMLQSVGACLQPDAAGTT
jgi:two-component system chemotaxis response regulator CheY